MAETTIENLFDAEFRDRSAFRPAGRILSAGRGLFEVGGLARDAALGDHVRFEGAAGRIRGEIVGLCDSAVSVFPDGDGAGLRVGDPAVLIGPPSLAPDRGWLGRIVDPHGKPLDGRPLGRSSHPRALFSAPPPASARKPFGPRLDTGLAVFDTLLPVVRGQRIGLFAGSGVGKSSLLGMLARGLEADVVVIALVGERGRELGSFVRDVLGPEGLARSVVVVSTSDQPPLSRRLALPAALTVAEHFRDEGQHVLLLADSITRFAEAHREVALASGESASMRGFPPSMAHATMSLAERTGPGAYGCDGDITAVFSTLVAGSDMDEPVADTIRGVLDGHVVLDREIAERGRYPAIDVLRSVSRSLPSAATPRENAIIATARQRLGAYARAELMIQSGLYEPGSDAATDAAIKVWTSLDHFVSEPSDCVASSFLKLSAALAPGGLL
ncbi:FliI/YscN family ATPase [Tropicimonas sp. IMCC34011]|uniref:FliI/YscN family ATPase n=1 Tax=Tropicimonas sp. IMCC34011 TaxID=2248759 RepID=UPI000E28551B|nr:FliI/YscN family ATPase [Tropicimonas sp. IMCC34011]